MSDPQNIGINGQTPPDRVNSDLVLQLIHLLEQAKQGKIVNAAIVVTGGPGMTGFILPNGPGATDLYLGLGAAQRRIEYAMFPNLLEQALAESKQRNAAAQSAARLIVPNGILRG